MNKKTFARRCAASGIPWISYVEGAIDLEVEYLTVSDYNEMLEAA